MLQQCVSQKAFIFKTLAWINFDKRNKKIYTKLCFGAKFFEEDLFLLLLNLFFFFEGRHNYFRNDTEYLPSTKIGTIAELSASHAPVNFMVLVERELIFFFFGGGPPSSGNPDTKIMFTIFLKMYLFALVNEL